MATVTTLLTLARDTSVFTLVALSAWILVGAMLAGSATTACSLDVLMRTRTAFVTVTLDLAVTVIRAYITAWRLLLVDKRHWEKRAEEVREINNLYKNHALVLSLMKTGIIISLTSLSYWSILHGGTQQTTQYRFHSTFSLITRRDCMNHFVFVRYMHA